MLKTFFEGRLGADAELKTPQNGGAQFYSMRIATNDYKNGTDDTVWVNVRVNADRAGRMKFTKGSHVLVTGTLRVSTYQNKAGETIPSIDVMADSISYVKSSSSGGTQSDSTEQANFGQFKKNEEAAAAEPVPAGTSAASNVDDLPF
jgi:single-stranded DNA-binding protein